MTRFTTTFEPISKHLARVDPTCNWCEKPQSECTCVECATCHKDVTHIELVITDLPCGHPVWGMLRELPYIAFCFGCAKPVGVRKRGNIFCSIECAAVYK